ncbi:MAG: YgaP family membrane protein [Halobacteriota archaeon]|uniref:YgaP family membrane protein n=1 Tax=Natronomonas sp. TaxID=2184060 RepID=UPI0039751401
MEKNVGGYDRIGRFVIGAILLVVGITGYAGAIPVAVGPAPQALTSIILVVIGAVLLVTGYTQRCVINRVLGMNTNKRGSQ